MTCHVFSHKSVCVCNTEIPLNIDNRLILGEGAHWCYYAWHCDFKVCGLPTVVWREPGTTVLSFEPSLPGDKRVVKRAIF